MAKKKVASNVEANIRWFAKMRHTFNFSGSNEFFLKRRLIYRKVGDNWEYENSMSDTSFINAFGPSYQRDGIHSPNWKTKIETEDCIQYDRNGVDAVEAFIRIDSYGEVRPTRHPTLLFNLLKVKASVNLHIQMYAEDRANGILPKLLFDDMRKEFGFLPWMVEAVENQKATYYK